MRIIIKLQELEVSNKELEILKLLDVKFGDNIVGKEYIPSDNSYCLNLKTKKQAHIVPGFCSEEEGACFRIVSDVYEETIESWGKRYTYPFVNILSSKTNNVYRVLYDFHGVK